MKAKAVELKKNLAGEYEISFKLSQQPDLAHIQKLYDITKNGKELRITAKRWTDKRSINANNYSWVLCQKIGMAIGISKELVYMRTILDKGNFYTVPVKDEAVERYCEIWRSHGLGWLTQTTSSKIPGYTNVITYYGSSEYDTTEMARHIDSLVEEAKELGIETMNPKEIEHLISEWDEEKNKDNG
jgi:hypothetical protein